MPQPHLLINVNNEESHNTVIYTRIKKTLGVQNTQIIPRMDTQKNGFTVLAIIERKIEVQEIIFALKEIKGVQEINVKN